MNMKTILATMILTASATAFAAATDNLLYWQVDLSDSNPNNVPAFSYATVRESSSGDYLYLYDTYGTALGTSVVESEYVNAGDTGWSTGEPVYAGLGSKLASSYVFELWKEDVSGNSTMVGHALYSSAQLADYIYQTRTGTAGNVPLSVAVVPEPTSALLLLFGIAGLALRRRKGKVALVLVAAMAMQFSAFAGADRMCYVFQPNANDKYADGTEIVLGECYAMVRLADGSDGIEIAANGTVVDETKGEILQVRQSSTKKKGRSINFQFDPDTREAIIAKGGKFAVYLLDTRSYDSTGKVSTWFTTNTENIIHAPVINAAKLLEDTVVAVDDSNWVGTSDTYSVDGVSVATPATTIPAGTPESIITGIKLVGDNVYVTVSNTVPYIHYNLKAGESVGEVESSNLSGTGGDAVSPRTGVAGEEIELVVPADGLDSKFFRVKRN